MHSFIRELIAQEQCPKRTRKLDKKYKRKEAIAK